MTSKPIIPARTMRATPRSAGGGRHREALVEKARLSIAKGSKSFAAASSLFDVLTRERVWLLYAWCRRCDDIADCQDHGGTLGLPDCNSDSAADRIEAIGVLTRRAMDDLPTADVAFDAFGLVSEECSINAALADDVIAGFALDAKGWRPRTERDLMQYCYHVAGAVGVMMALVMGVDPDDAETLDRACDLGFAFQLANIARDIEEDDAAGRCYLPTEWLAEMDIAPGEHMKPHYRDALTALAARLIERMEIYAASASEGAMRLPFRSRWAILSASRIYTAIGREVRARGAHAWDKRVHTGKLAKLGHVIGGFWAALRRKPELPSTAPEFSRRDFSRP
jgi:phytoene synthase